MHPFSYSPAQDAATAITALASEQTAAFVAGGTSLLDLMKLDVQTPSHLIDINALPLTGITVQGNKVSIGALARNSDVAYDTTIRERFPLLSQALLAGASPQLRNMATVGGNLLQRTRCYYFRDVSMPCNKRAPGTGCSAINGYNRIHAILGGSEHCIAVHPSDMAVALVALDAIVQVRGPQGERSIPLTSFYLLPDDHPERESILAHGELIVAVDVPASASSFAPRSHYLKVRDRASFDFALVSVAAALAIQDGRIQQARLALGGVGTVPWRAYKAEQALIGQQPGETAYQAAAQAAVEGAVPRQYNAFKIPLAQQSVMRALEMVGGKA